MRIRHVKILNVYLINRYSVNSIIMNMLFKRTEIIASLTSIRANQFLALLSDLHVPLNILTNYPNICV